jgi:hypothetical protein
MMGLVLFYVMVAAALLVGFPSAYNGPSLYDARSIPKSGTRTLNTRMLLFDVEHDRLWLLHKPEGLAK